MNEPFLEAKSDASFLPRKQSSLIGGVDDGNPPPERYEKGLGRRQLSSMLKKNYILKKRNLRVTCCELLAPLALMALLVLGWTVALNEAETTDAMIYANDTSTIDDIASLLQLKAEIRPVDEERPVPQDPSLIEICPNITQIPGTNFTVPPGFELCFDVGLVSQFAVLASLSTYNGPLPIPNFEEFVALHRAIEGFAGNDSFRIPGLSDQFLGVLLQLGKLSFSPDTTEVRDLVDHLNTTNPSFEEFFQDIFETEQDALDFALDDSDGQPSKLRTWAVINFASLDIEGGHVEYTIRQNYTVLPSTELLVQNTRIVMPGLNPDYQSYFSSGFLTLQLELDNYILQTSNPATFETIQPAAVAFPTPAFDVNPFYAGIGPLAGLVMVLALLYPFSQLMRGIVEEKESRTKETMKMMGLKNWVFSCNWFLTYLMIFTFISVTSTIMLSQNVFGRTSPAVLFVLVFTFCTSMIMFAFLISTFFSRAKLAAIVGPIILFVTTAPRYAFFQAGPTDELGLKQLSCLLSPTAFSFAIDILVGYEGANLGVNFGNIGDEPLPVSAIIGLQIFDFFLYSLLAWYFDKVLPDEFGTRKKFYFLCTPSYWCGKKNSESPRNVPGYLPAIDEYKKVEMDVPHNDNIEPVPDHYDGRSTVQIRNLRKVFTQGQGGSSLQTVAVRGLHLQLYEKHITALLGHNGAGKTTLISMMTGLLEPTSGDCIINGNSILDSMQEIRQSLGVCPQHNVLFDVLTVLEHLTLYATLKGVYPADIKQMCEDIIQDVGLQDKRDVSSSALSGGMKRKLQVAIALIGGSKIIFLDEPTSGMDPYSRRSTWELLRKMKNGRTIILTTHFMDEADLLGDRIAIMSHGNLQCCGSSLFLKSRYGVGYTMTMTQSSEDCDENEIDELVIDHIPSATLLSVAGGEISYRLPLEATPQFPALFKYIEECREKLHIGGYGVSMTTMEEVFMRITQSYNEEDVAEFSRKHSIAGATIDEIEKQSSRSSFGSLQSSVSSGTEIEVVRSPQKKEPKLGDIAETGKVSVEKIHKSIHVLEPAPVFYLPKDRSFTRQLLNMVNKRFICAKRDLKGRFFEVILPVLVVAIVLLILKVNFNPAGPSIGLNSQIFQEDQFALNNRRRGQTVSGDFPTEIVYSAEGFPEDLLQFFTDQPKETFMTSVGSNNSVGVSESLLEDYSLHNMTRYGAFVFDDLLFFNSTIDLPSFTIDNPTGIPIPITNLSVPFSIPNSLSILFNSTSSHSFPAFYNEISQARFKLSIAQRENKAAIDPEDATLVADNHPLPLTRQFELAVQQFLALFAALFVLIPFCYLPASFMIFVVKERTVKARHLQLVSGVNPIAYWVGTYIWDMINYSFVLILVMAVFGIYGNTEFVGSAESFFATWLLLWFYGFAAIALSYCLSFLFESHSTAQIGIAGIHFVLGFVLVVASFILDTIDNTKDTNMILKNFYRIFPQYCMGEGLINLALIPIFALFGTTSHAFAWDQVGRNLVYLFIEAVVYFSFCLLLEKGTLGQIWLKIKYSFKSLNLSNYKYNVLEEDEDVVAEKERVMSGKADNELIVIKDLLKVYPARGNNKQPVTAVNGISLGISKGQCFGFLGINGAGKTSTLQILTGDQSATDGTASINGHDVHFEIEEVRQVVGYCPQFDPLLEKMNGREHLRMFGRLRGIHENELEPEVTRLINKLGLTEFADKESGTYSGGNKRKLSLAIALMGNPSVVFLDEPSTGMDPVARRFMWDVIASISQERSVILTTHSMEECEALCNRLCIMTTGNLRCLGSIQHLKNKFGQGYQMEISTTDGNISQIQQFVDKTFEGAILEEFHSGRLNYHLPVVELSLSQIFSQVEENRKELGITDYSISQSTLEQIFVAIAKYQDPYARDDEEEEEDGDK